MEGTQGQSCYHDPKYLAKRNDGPAPFGASHLFREFALGSLPSREDAAMAFQMQKIRSRFRVLPAVVPRPQGFELISWHLDLDRVRHEAITELYLRGLSPGHVLRAKGGMCSTRPLLATGPRS